jgi:hypothetical protein
VGNIIWDIIGGIIEDIIDGIIEDIIIVLEHGSSGARGRDG